MVEQEEQTKQTRRENARKGFIGGMGTNRPFPVNPTLLRLKNGFFAEAFQ